MGIRIVKNSKLLFDIMKTTDEQLFRFRPEKLYRRTESKQWGVGVISKRA